MISTEQEPILIRLIVRPADMSYFQLILESYEGIVTVSTLDVRAGLLQVSIMPGWVTEARSALSALANEISLSIPDPNQEGELLNFSDFVKRPDALLS